MVAGGTPRELVQPFVHGQTYSLTNAQPQTHYYRRWRRRWPCSWNRPPPARGPRDSLGSEALSTPSRLRRIHQRSRPKDFSSPWLDGENEECRGGLGAKRKVLRMFKGKSKCPQTDATA